MQSAYNALMELNLDKNITVITAHSLAMLEMSYPPSDGAFQRDLRGFITPILDFHVNQFELPYKRVSVLRILGQSEASPDQLRSVPAKCAGEDYGDGAGEEVMSRRRRGCEFGPANLAQKGGLSAHIRTSEKDEACMTRTSNSNITGVCSCLENHFL
ncbi:hypothetical protein RHSIM_Rhsim07G0135300 [Rhododendron simsii]|uniref:Uncharacterized protein n=1 Tax=Rhododendron simsii TaxID=118357 RepID=A0A834LLF2_RHOSS|nr:hypothetical protein RHSIM_Rhsim07G0135300 [Rhododendron simsii]